jgi:hypothetical protein
MKKYLLTLAFLGVTGAAHAQYGTSFIIPTAPANYGQDRVVVNGFECSSAVGTQKHFEVGALGQQSQYQQFGAGVNGGSTYAPATSGGAYARIVIPLDAPKQRPNCNRLYEIELEKRELELEFFKKNMATPKDAEFKK